MAIPLFPPDKAVPISSGMTALYRTNFPIGALLAAAASALGALALRQPGLAVMALLALAASATLYFGFRRLTDISVTGDTLHVAIAKTTYPIPLSEVDNIEVRLTIRPPVGFVYFKRTTAAGPYVMFIPRGFTLLGRNPLVDALNDRARRLSSLSAPGATNTAPTTSET